MIRYKSASKKKAAQRKRLLQPPLPKGKILHKHRLTRADYVQILDQADRYPLLMRVAAELWRRGVRLNEFEDDFHLVDFGPSKVVHGHMTDFHFERGMDPARVGPCLPIFVESAVTSARTLIPQGRPTQEKADVVLRALERLVVQAGWHPSDFEAAAQRFMDKQDDGAPLLKLATAIVLDDDDEPVTKAASKESKKPRPVCKYCNYDIKDRFVTYHGEDGPDVLHLNCWWLSKATPIDIPINAEVFSIKDAQTYCWDGQRWRPKKKVAQTAASTPEPTAGHQVVATAIVPVPPPTTGPLPSVPAPCDTSTGKPKEVRKALPPRAGAKRSSASPAKVVK